ncbi:MAG: TIGR02147 family protein [Fibrobacterales bacterium]
MHVNIYNYLDYSLYLREWYKEKKVKAPGTTLENLAQSIDISSKSYLSRIFNGSNPLSHRSLKTILPLFELSPPESEYFYQLLSLKHAQSDREKENALTTLESIQNPETSKIQSKKYHYFRKWYTPVIRELACSSLFKGRLDDLRYYITPTISHEEIRKSIELLLQLNLIKKDGDQYAQTDTVIAATDPEDYVALRKHQKDMMGMGIEALERIPAEERNILTCTAGVSHEGYTEIQQAVTHFQNTLADILQRQHRVEKCFQVNLQFFPLSRSLSKGKGAS